MITKERVDWFFRKYEWIQDFVSLLQGAELLQNPGCWLMNSKAVFALNMLCQIFEQIGYNVVRQWPLCPNQLLWEMTLFDEVKSFSIIDFERAVNPKQVKNDASLSERESCEIRGVSGGRPTHAWDQLLACVNVHFSHYKEVRTERASSCSLG